MSSKTFIWIGMVVGSTVGGMIPGIWGASFLSFSSIFLSAVGAIAGIYVGFKMSRNF